jgi:hypothetical protein
MRKTVYILMACLLATSALFISGCDKDDPDNPSSSVPDPAGTVLVSMRNWDNGGTRVTPDGCYGDFVIWRDDNFYHPDFDNYKFTTIGAMKGIGNITKIPASGWADKVSVMPGYGYVGASYRSDVSHTSIGVTYFRIYVEDYITSTSGGIIGAEVKYLSPFHVKSDASAISVSQSVVNLSNTHGYSEDIAISPYLTTWTVSSSADWCWVATTGLDRFRIWVGRNNEYNSSPRTATVTVKIESLPDKTITVTQAGI